MAGLSALALALAACGVEGKKAAPPQQSDVEKYWSDKKQNGQVDFANWPLYMDPKRPELKQFTERDRDHGELPRGHPGDRRAGSRRSSRSSPRTSRSATTSW